MHRSVSSLRENTEWHVFAKYLDDILDGVKVTDDLADAVAPAYDRYYLQEVESLGCGRILEHIGTGAEYGRSLARAQHDQGVHQSIAMVRSKYDRTIFRNVLHSQDLYPAEGHSGAEIHKRTQVPVPETHLMQISAMELLI